MAEQSFLSRALANVEKKTKEAPVVGTPQFIFRVEVNGEAKEFVSDLDLAFFSSPSFKELIFKAAVAPHLNSSLNQSNPDERRKVRNKVAKVFKDHWGSTGDEIYQSVRQLTPDIESDMMDHLAIANDKTKKSKNPI